MKVLGQYSLTKLTSLMHSDSATMYVFNSTGKSEDYAWPKFSHHIYFWWPIWILTMAQHECYWNSGHLSTDGGSFVQQPELQFLWEEHIQINADCGENLLGFITSSPDHEILMAESPQLGWVGVLEAWCDFNGSSSLRVGQSCSQSALGETSHFVLRVRVWTDHCFSAENVLWLSLSREMWVCVCMCVI